MGIPCMVMDEHRDAYWYWWQMIDAGWIAHKDNYLLHVDHHDDALGGGYAWDLHAMPSSADEALAFTDACLGIADFIVPAMWQGVFSTWHALKSVLPAPIREERRMVRLSPREELVCEPYFPLLHKRLREEGGPERRFFDYREGGLAGAGDMQSVHNVVLDVDLDYFCWDDSLGSRPNKRIEITKAAWDDYHADRNHPFRIIPKKLVRAVEEDGRYFLQYSESIARDPLPSERTITRRVDRLFRWLEERDVMPAAIDVCRSSYSGYLPAERAKLVEELFFDRLCTAYAIDMEPTRPHSFNFG